MTFLKSLIIPAFAVVLFSSCDAGADKKSGTDSKVAQEEARVTDAELKAFMVGGIYFTNGYGGKSETDKIANQNGTKDKELVEGYREIFILPFKKEDGSGAKSMLSNAWDINNKADMEAVLTKLENHKMESSYTKAWDFARYVNNACMGYASGFLTEQETKDKVKALLPKVQAAYSDWDAFFADFMVGRNKWDAEESEDKKAYAALSSTMTQGEHNIYKVLPLKD